MSKIYISKENRKLVFERANFLCEYCLSLDQFSSSKFIIEHIIPISKNGSSDIENLALACHDCNFHKYNKIAEIDPETNLLSALYNPRKDN